MWQELRGQCPKLNFNATTIRGIEQRWPYFWDFVNMVVQRAMVQRHSARVDMATTDQAIKGNDRDRRLYYEVFKGLKRGAEEHKGPSTIVFVNNVIARPEAVEAITASTAEKSAEPLGPGVVVDLSMPDDDREKP